MPLSPEAEALLDQMKASGARPRDTYTVQEVRERALAALRANPPRLVPLARVEDRVMAGPGGDLPLRIYWADLGEPRPIVMFFHGGGWTVGTLETHDGPCRTLANLSGCIVISVEFRLAPENKFPAGLEDCYAATLWASENAASIGGDPDRLAVCGNSSGGNAAAAVALMARDRGKPRLAYQILVCASTDALADTQSRRDYGDGYGLFKSESAWFQRNYLNSMEERAHPYVSPLRAPDLSGVAPALVLGHERSFAALRMTPGQTLKGPWHRPDIGGLQVACRQFAAVCGRMGRRSYWGGSHGKSALR